MYQKKSTYQSHAATASNEKAAGKVELTALASTMNCSLETNGKDAQPDNQSNDRINNTQPDGLGLLNQHDDSSSNRKTSSIVRLNVLAILWAKRMEGLYFPLSKEMMV